MSGSTRCSPKHGWFFPRARRCSASSLSHSLWKNSIGCPPVRNTSTFARLGMIAITVMLLMTPAAFHRVAEGGEDSDRLVRISSVAVITAMAPLALGISLDFFVVVRKVTGSVLIAVVCATAASAMFLGLWFGYTMVKRRKRQRRHSSRPQTNRAR